MTNFCHLGGVVCVYNFQQGTAYSVPALDWSAQLSIYLSRKNRPRESDFFVELFSKSIIFDRGGFNMEYRNRLFRYHTGLWFFQSRQLKVTSRNYVNA